MTVRYGYNPMRSPAKTVSEDRMCEILAQRSGKPVSLAPPPLRKTLSLKPKSEAARELEQELWLIHRLGAHGAAVDLGITDRELRRERMREAIHKVGPLIILGPDKNGKPLTYAQAFERLYHVPFEP